MILSNIIQSDLIDKDIKLQFVFLVWILENVVLLPPAQWEQSKFLSWCLWDTHTRLQTGSSNWAKPTAQQQLRLLFCRSGVSCRPHSHKTERQQRRTRTERRGERSFPPQVNNPLHVQPADHQDLSFGLLVHPTRSRFWPASCRIRKFRREGAAGGTGRAFVWILLEELWESQAASHSDRNETCSCSLCGPAGRYRLLDNGEIQLVPVLPVLSLTRLSESEECLRRRRIKASCQAPSEPELLDGTHSSAGNRSSEMTRLFGSDCLHSEGCSCCVSPRCASFCCASPSLPSPRYASPRCASFCCASFCRSYTYWHIYILTLLHYSSIKYTKSFTNFFKHVKTILICLISTIRSLITSVK